MGTTKKIQKYNKKTSHIATTKWVGCEVGWEPFLEAREKHAPPKGCLSATGRNGILWSRQGLKRKVKEDAGVSSTRRLKGRAIGPVESTRRHPSGDGDR
jgi:hypothetical protein